MNTIIFKSYYLTKALYWLFGIGAIFTTVIYLEFNTAGIDKNSICTGVVGIMALFVLYLNRLEPHYIKFDNSDFTVDFINKFVFKRGVKTYAKAEIKVSSQPDKLLISNSSGRLVIIRKDALAPNDWLFIREYFFIS